MKKKIDLLDPETDEIMAQVELITIDWFDDIQSSWAQFLNNGGESLVDFKTFLENETGLKINILSQ